MLKGILDLIIETAESGKVGAAIQMLKELRDAIANGNDSLFAGHQSREQLVDAMWNKAIEEWNKNQSLRLPGEVGKGSAQ